MTFPGAGTRHQFDRYRRDVAGHAARRNPGRDRTLDPQWAEKIRRAQRHHPRPQSYWTIIQPALDTQRKTDLDATNIRAAVDSSLLWLHTDYIDLYQMHWPSRNVPIFGQNAFNPDAECPCSAIE